MHMPEDADEILINTTKVNRACINFLEFAKDYESCAIQVFGGLESIFFSSLDSNARKERLLNLFKKKVFAVVCSGFKIFPEMLDVVKVLGVPLLKTSDHVDVFLAYLTCYLNEKLGLRAIFHGVFIEVCGEGALILGESGVGKSETALELVKRGNILVADDRVVVVKVVNDFLKAFAPKNIRHFMEVKSIGIVNVKELYGVKAVKNCSKLDFVVCLKENYGSAKRNIYKNYFEQTYFNILNVAIPYYVVLKKPDFNLANIIETLAVSNRKKKMGCYSEKDVFLNMNLND